MTKRFMKGSDAVIDFRLVILRRAHFDRRRAYAVLCSLPRGLARVQFCGKRQETQNRYVYKISPDQKRNIPQRCGCASVPSVSPVVSCVSVFRVKSLPCHESSRSTATTPAISKCKRTTASPAA